MHDALPNTSTETRCYMHFKTLMDSSRAVAPLEAASHGHGITSGENANMPRIVDSSIMDIMSLVWHERSVIWPFRRGCDIYFDAAGAKDLDNCALAIIITSR